MRTRVSEPLPDTATGRTAPGWSREWAEADAVERAEAARAPRPPARWVGAGFVLGVAASLAALAPALFSLSPGYSPGDTLPAVVAAVSAAAIALACALLAATIAAKTTTNRASGAGTVLLFGAALLSVGAAAIHIAVAKMHFDEYTLYGVFFVISGAGQLLWAVLVLFRPVRPLLVLGAVGNLLIAALWAVDRTWGLPIGPEHWKPETIGVADSVSTAFELVLALGCLALFAPTLRAEARSRLPALAGLALLLAVGVPTVLGLLSAIGAVPTLLKPSA
jgi:hypothetical protein